jgi:hypothetical protein
MQKQSKVDLDCRLIAEYVDEAELPPQAAYHRGEVLRPHVAGSYVDVGSPLDHKDQPKPTLSTTEQALLLALVAECKGIGWGVSVYLFESVIRELGIDLVDANIAVAGLQQKELVRLEERAGWDKVEDRASLYPVYCVTSQGFTVTLQVRTKL